MTEEKTEDKQQEILYENKYYFIVRGKSTHSDKDIDCYQIISKEHNIIESESSVFPIAVGNAIQFMQEIDNLPIESVGSEIVTLN